MNTVKFIRETRSAIGISKCKLDSRLRVTRVVKLNAFREQALAAALPPARQRGTARFCFHAGAKTVLTFACSLGWLVSPLHKTEK